MNVVDGELQPSITTSAGLAGVITDETGTGDLVFSDSPDLTTPTITSGGRTFTPGSIWMPEDNGWISEAYPLTLSGAPNSSLVTAGLVRFSALKIPKAQTVKGVALWVGTAGVALTANQCFVGIYQNDILLGTSADQSTAWLSNNLVRADLVGNPIPVAAGEVVVAWFYNGTTGPTFARSGAAGSGANPGDANYPNVGLVPATYRAGTADAGRTTSLPGTLGTRTPGTAVYWAALYA